MSGRTEWQERIGVGMRAVGIGIDRDATRTTVVRHDDTGARVGRTIDHSDGRRDAVAEKVSVTVNPGLRAVKE